MLCYSDSAEGGQQGGGEKSLYFPSVLYIAIGAGYMAYSLRATHFRVCLPPHDVIRSEPEYRPGTTIFIDSKYSFSKRPFSFIQRSILKK